MSRWVSIIGKDHDHDRDQEGRGEYGRGDRGRDDRGRDDRERRERERLERERGYGREPWQQPWQRQPVPASRRHSPARRPPHYSAH